MASRVRMGGEPALTIGERELVITRVIEAPRPLVFKAWTDPALAARWWGPHGFTVHSCEMDPRPGGVCRLCMRSPEGVDHWRHGVYREVVEPPHLVFTWAGQDSDGRPGPETVVTVTFAEEGSKTRLILRQTGLDEAVERESRRTGWTQGLEKLADLLART